MHTRITILFSCLLFLTINIFAQGECSEFIQQALEVIEQACATTGRNQACLGHFAADAIPQPDVTDFQFSAVGDITDVAAIQSLQLSAFDIEAGVWGLILMQIQANVPNTLPGQNVSVLLFGEVNIRNAADSMAEQTPEEMELSISVRSNVNVRSLPSTEAPIVEVISASTVVTANGRTEDGLWIRIRSDNGTGWIFSQLLLTDFIDMNSLQVVAPDAPFYGPMQAFYISTGIGNPTCHELPRDGMLVQTPEGVASITLTVNEIQVEMGSTVYFSYDETQNLSIAPVDGAARITVNNETQTVVEGGYVQVAIGENMQASTAPLAPQSYLGDTNVQNLPLSPLTREVVADGGLEDAELELLLTHQILFNYLNIGDADEFLDFLAETPNADIPAYLIGLGYGDFGVDVEAYLESLGYDLSSYPNYQGNAPSSSGGDDDDDDDDDD